MSTSSNPSTNTTTTTTPSRGRTAKENLPTEEELREYHDPPEELAEKVKILADIVRSSSYIVAYTGAGISHSSGIPTYRGPDGCWTRRDKGLPPPRGTPLEAALPTPGHMALFELVQKGVVRHVVSTNLDGLHRRSGITADQLSELHGNIYLEKCTLCESEFLRKRRVKGDKNHLTGHTCSNCGGALKDTIINFKESLPEIELAKATEHSYFADLSIVIGTSMKVHPACDLPLVPLSQPEGKMVIINLQKTPYDDLAFLRIFHESDRVLQLLNKELGLDIPPFTKDHIKDD